MTVAPVVIGDDGVAVGSLTSVQPASDREVGAFGCFRNGYLQKVSEIDGRSKLRSVYAPPNANDPFIVKAYSQIVVSFLCY